MRISDWSSDVCSSDLISEPDGTVVVAVDDSVIGQKVPLGERGDRRLRTWTGDLAFGDREAIGAQVPIISEDSELVGVVTVAEAYPTLGDRARRWLPDLVTFLGIGLLDRKSTRLHSSP